MKDRLWGIVDEKEAAPDIAEPERHTKFEARRDCVLALIVLAMETSLHYSSKYSVAVWKKLSDRFQK